MTTSDLVERVEAEVANYSPSGFKSFYFSFG